MKPLYEIANEYQSILYEIADSEEVTEEQTDLLAQYEDDIKNKIINVAAFIKNLESEHEAIEKAVDNMVDRSIKISKKVDRLKDYLKSNMELCNIYKVKSPYFDIKIKHNPYSVKIENEDLIPSKYIEEITAKKIDKTIIARDLKNNMIVPGVFLERNTRLEIK